MQVRHDPTKPFLAGLEAEALAGVAELERMPSWKQNSQLFAVFYKITSPPLLFLGAHFGHTIAQMAVTANNSIQKHTTDSGLSQLKSSGILPKFPSFALQQSHYYL